jgi:hypothetical protein
MLRIYSLFILSIEFKSCTLFYDDDHDINNTSTPSMLVKEVVLDNDTVSKV